MALKNLLNAKLRKTKEFNHKVIGKYGLINSWPMECSYGTLVLVNSLDMLRMRYANKIQVHDSLIVP